MPWTSMIPHVLSVFVVQWENFKKKKFSLQSDPVREMISLSYDMGLKILSTVETHSRLPYGSDKK